MILHPGVLALLVASTVTAGMLVYASWHALRIIRFWDIGSGSDLQLALERRTYLISTIAASILGFQGISLLLYVHTADSLHPLFTGAMCAAGTLNTGGYGYPLLLVKISSFLLSGVWLILNHADSRGWDYPLVRRKYPLLLMLLPVAVADAALSIAFFAGMETDVITSCCGSLFSSGKRSIAGDLAALPPLPTMAAFYGGMGATGVTGAWFLTGRRGGAVLFPAAGIAAFFISVASVISFISLYYYDLPTHHCPFCIFQKEYAYVGYLLFGTLFPAAVCAAGAGVVAPFRGVPSLRSYIPRLQRRLAVAAMLLYGLFTLTVTWRILTSTLTLR